MMQTPLFEALFLVSMPLLQKYVLCENIDHCKAEGFPGPHESWNLFSGEVLNLNWNLFPKYPDHVYYELSCDKSSWPNDHASSKYLIDVDPLGSDNWNCGSYRQSVIWGCNTTNGSWTSWRNIDQDTSDFYNCSLYDNVAEEDIPLRDECCTPWSDYTLPVKQPNHCIATCLWYPLQDPENGFRMWDVERNPYNLAPQGADILYVCNDGYHIDGDPHVRCTEHGNWTSIPHCEKNQSFVKRFTSVFVVLVWITVSFVTVSMALAYKNFVRQDLCRQHDQF